MDCTNTYRFRIPLQDLVEGAVNACRQNGAKRSVIIASSDASLYALLREKIHELDSEIDIYYSDKELGRVEVMDRIDTPYCIEADRMIITQ